MINNNGNLVQDNNARIDLVNRGLYYGDSVFETMRAYLGNILFFENHYFRLMSSMRIMRMDIPDSFTPEFLEQSIKELVVTNKLDAGHARVRFTVWRDSEGFYTPQNNTVAYAITTSRLESGYALNYINDVELFKDYYVQPSLLANIKGANKHLNILAGIYGAENDYDDMLLINDQKMVVETIAGNLFIRNGHVIKTPPITDGCLNGIMRGKVLERLKKMANYTVVEESVTTFELQRADELFTTNVISGIQSIKRFRKKTFEHTTALEILELLASELEH